MVLPTLKATVLSQLVGNQWPCEEADESGRFDNGNPWLVVLRREQAGNPADYFNRSCEDYEEGFGDSGKEFWLGLNKMANLTQENEYGAKFELLDWDGQTYQAYYENFKVGPGPDFELEIDSFVWPMGRWPPSVGDTMRYQVGNPFQCVGRDEIWEDKRCSAAYNGGGGWWYRSGGPCFFANLNGPNYPEERSSGVGIMWVYGQNELRYGKPWKGATMMIRQKSTF